MIREHQVSGRRTAVARSLVALGALLTSACIAGPNYQRPPVTMPDAFRSQTPHAEVAREVSVAAAR
jgi:hypothetical protein